MNSPNQTGGDLELNPGIYDKFDFTNYKIADNQVAFGIRTGWRTMYSGGGGYFGALMLFVVQENKIINILSEPVYEEGLSGGGYDERKFEWETKNIIVMLPKKTSGYYDLQIKDSSTNWSRIFKWSTDRNRYIPWGKNNKPEN